jgi:hypothetical protein
MYLALKKTPRPTLLGPITHCIGKFLDKSPYSHGELVFRDGWCASSVMGYGVRFKRIDFAEGAWDFFSLPDELEPKARAWFLQNSGCRYDYLYMLRFGCTLLSQSLSRWGCFEAIGAALGWTGSWRYGPGGTLARCIDQYGSKRISNVERIHIQDCRGYTGSSISLFRVL